MEQVGFELGLCCVEPDLKLDMSLNDVTEPKLTKIDRLNGKLKPDIDVYITWKNEKKNEKIPFH